MYNLRFLQCTWLFIFWVPLGTGWGAFPFFFGENGDSQSPGNPPARIRKILPRGIDSFVGAGDKEAWEAVAVGKKRDEL